MIGTAFPLTCVQARREVAMLMLRSGIITEVRPVIA